MRWLKSLFVFSILTCSQLCIAEDSPRLHFSPAITIGAGLSLITTTPFYGSLKVSVVDLGSTNEGIHLLAVGASLAPGKANLLLSPIILFHNHCAISIDYGSDIIGIGFGYTF